MWSNTLADQVSVTIDGRSTKAQRTATILSVARQLGIDIPTLCYMDDRKPNESCGVCMVEVEGRDGLLPACATRVQDGMVVRTDTEAVRRSRRVALELLLSDHLGDCAAPCQLGCPAHIDIPRFIVEIRNGKYDKAIAIIKESVAFPGVLGRICPKPCEAVCRRKNLDEAVAVCALKRFVADRDMDSGPAYVPPKNPPTGKRVAIVGAGIAGLTAAYYLLVEGHACAVFDAKAEPGGALRLIPELRLPRRVFEAELAVVTKLGMDFHGGQTLGENLALDDLRSGYDAVLLATGLGYDVTPEKIDVDSSCVAADVTPDVGTLRRLGVETSERCVTIDHHTFMTRVDGIFAAGRITGGGRYAVHASASGRHAAEAISRHLAGETAESKKPVHVLMRHLSGADLANLFHDVRKTPSVGAECEDDAVTEAKRCLQCACTKRDECLLRIYATEYEANPHAFAGERPTFEREGTHEEVVYEPGKCIKCGRCILIAREFEEHLGLTYIGRGFHVRVGVSFGETLKAGLTQAALACADACPTGALARRRRGRW
ncbi:MAG: NAD(P)-binding protein [Planctomycetes bacterium]|nr:NAD(P)-binding protein [Planctomycetota bacterium]